MIGIGMTFLVLGIICFCIGWMSRPKNGIVLGMGALIMVGGMFIGIGGNPARGMPNGSPAMVAVGFIMVAVGVVMIVIQLVNAKKSGQIRAAKMVEERKIAFYNECVKMGIENLNNEVELKRAILVAKKHNFDEDVDIKALLNEGRQLEKQEMDEKNKEKNKKLADEERVQFDELNEFSNLQGADKRISMLSKIIDEKQKAIDAARAKANWFRTNPLKEKEHDWAVHGGIADAIAGPGAGIATAMHIEQENAVIRERNQVKQAEANKLADYIERGTHGDWEEIRKLKPLLDEAKTKLVADLSSDDCFDHLVFSNTNLTVSETGTIIVTTDVELDKPMKVFDDITGVIDGTIMAVIHKEDSIIGEATMVFPVFGVMHKSYEKCECSTLKGMSLFCGNKNEEYEVSFAPVNLWAMEK